MPRPEYFVFNDENVKNSYGFYINTLGIKMDRFNDNPVMLNNHINSTENVIGNWSDAVKENGQLKLKPHFDEESNLGKEIAGKVDRGFLKGCSMGIIPNWDSVQKVGDRLIMMECELAEGTIIPVPSNKGAIAIYSADGTEVLKAEDIKSLCLSVSEKLSEIPENLNKDHNMKKIILSLAAFVALGYDTKAIPNEGVDSSEIDSKILDLSAKLTATQAENAQLKTANETLVNAQNTQKLTAATTMVELAIKEGRIAADKKDSFIELAKANPELAKATLDSIPAKQNFAAGVTTPQGTGGAPEVKSMDDFQKLSIEEQLAFKANSPEEYKKLFA